MSTLDIERYMIVYGPALATAAVSWGNLPPTPKKIRAIQAKFGKPLQYLALTNLVLQGGGRMNIKTAGLVAAIFFVLNQFLDQ